MKSFFLKKKSFFLKMKSLFLKKKNCIESPIKVVALSESEARRVFKNLLLIVGRALLKFAKNKD